MSLNDLLLTAAVAAVVIVSGAGLASAARGRLKLPGQKPIDRSAEPGRFWMMAAFEAAMFLVFAVILIRRLG